jgi:hypothetical protein
MAEQAKLHEISDVPRIAILHAASLGGGMGRCQLVAKRRVVRTPDVQ